MNYRPRQLETILKDYLRYFPVIGLTGPRQSGKSTLLQHTLPDYTYVTFDDYRVINLFHNDPQRFLSIYSDKDTFSEFSPCLWHNTFKLTIYWAVITSVGRIVLSPF
jgi:hypothetical protein